MNDRLDTTALGALRAAKVWLNVFVKQIDIDPAETSFNVKAVSPDGERHLAKVTLAETLAQIDAAIAAGEAKG